MWTATGLEIPQKIIELSTLRRHISTTTHAIGASSSALEQSQSALTLIRALALARAGVSGNQAVSTSGAFFLCGLALAMCPYNPLFLVEGLFIVRFPIRWTVYADLIEPGVFSFR